MDQKPGDSERLRSFTSGRLLLGAIAEAGAEVGAVCDRLGLPPDAPSAKVLSMSRQTFARLCAEAEAITGDANLGLTLASKLGRGAYGLLDFGARAAADLRGAINTVIRFQRLLDDTSTFRLEESGPLATLEHHGLAGVRTYNEYVIALILSVGRSVIGAEWKARRAWFSHPRPADTARLAQFLGTTELDFDAATDGVLFDAAVLDQKLTTADPALHALLTEQAERALQAEPERADLVGQLREAVRAALAAGEAPSLDGLAPTLGMSGRTLQRRLAERGATFQDVVDELRLGVARLLLEGETLPVKAIVERLAYSDVRTFDRAFKRWTGLTPAEYRRSRRS